MRVFDVLAWILIINGLHELSVFLRRRFRGDLINIIGNIGVGIFILSYTAIPIRLLFCYFCNLYNIKWNYKIYFLFKL